MFDGLIWLIAPHGSIIINDIMAYFFGIKFGRKIFGDRPLTELSPNKTWEGFIFGLLSTMILTFSLAPLFASYHYFICPAGTWDPAIRSCPNIMPIFKYTAYPLPSFVTVPFSLIGLNRTTVDLMPFQFHALVYAIFAGLVAPFGGFLASGIKRAYNKKDFDTVIPGHGGLMDRADCQFLMSFFNQVYFLTFIQPAGSTGSILSQIALLSLAQQEEIVKGIQKMVDNHRGV